MKITTTLKGFSLVLCGLLFIALSSCKDECLTDSKCSEQPPSGTTCSAYWESWIYDSKTNECSFTGYSGCSPIGFDSKTECEKCDCN
jgi:hypothetical protein